MNSNWQIYKIGLINFWYYDEEEFLFEEGRMLLRGANGSGKSVTMQSFIPLLLDGNMRPERLDPFGSRARRMENYLLEENDGRDERTGYLYMEFKRDDTDVYVTIGIGMRARRGKPLETWYFFLQDGRRVGHDFFLYRQEREKVPLTRQELKNRLGEGGQVIESQKEYMSRVNRLIFGFETDEAYKELIDLLIQLRTPKLSKDFKPSIINDILTNSLMPLSEDDLRPMSEAIENMDGLKASLDNLKDTAAASRRIDRVYSKYNRFIMFDKVKRFREYLGKKKREEQEVSRIETELSRKENQQLEQKEQREALTRELEMRQKELDSYNDSDVPRLKKEEERLLVEAEQIKRETEQKETIHAGKREQRIDAENRKKDGLNETQRQESELTALLNSMDETLSQVTFDDHEFLQKELTERKDQAYSFTAHKELLNRLRGNMEAGIDQLKEEKLLKGRCDDQLKEVETYTGQRDAKEREQNQHQDQLRIVKNEQLETLNMWEQVSDEMQMPEETMRELFVLVENFSNAEDYDLIKGKAAEVFAVRQDELRLKRADIRHELDLKLQEVTVKRQEIETWEKMTDPTPERPEEVIRNREKLTEAGIDFLEFYKAIDFPVDMAEEQRDRLEEALLAMGILDALIVDCEDFAKIQALDKGISDRYILTDVSGVSSSLSEFMEIVNEDNDILLYQKVSRALGAVGFDSKEAAHTAIYEDGHYRIGAVTGTLTDRYKAKFIGVKARKEYREQKITELNEELKGLLVEELEITERIENVNQKLENLAQQWERFPDGGDLKVAVRDLEAVRYELKRLQDALEKAQSVLSDQMKQLNELRQKIRKICDKVYLPANLDMFQAAREELEQYQQDLHALELTHHKYLGGLAVIKNIEDQIEGLDEDIDIVLGDIRDLAARGRANRDRLQSIAEQLALTDAAAIEEKITIAVQRIREIPEELQLCAGEIGTLEEGMKSMKLERDSRTEKIMILRRQCQLLGEGVLKEAALGYYSAAVKEMAEEGIAEAEKISDLVYSSEESTMGSLDRLAVTEEQQRVYFENRAVLTEYSPVLNEIFSEHSEEASDDFRFNRLDLRARYRGVLMSFQEFVSRVEEDIEEKMGLLSDKERELFEDILLGVINRKIRAKIYSSEAWVEGMNKLMGDMRTSSGIRLSLRWKSKHAEHEDQLDTRKLVALFKKDQKWMKEEESEQLLNHFRSKIQEARKTLELEHGVRSFHAIVREILDYRQWFEFRLEFEKLGEKKKELTDRDFFTFSGGEKAMSMYVPLFSAVVAKYEAAREDAPRLISLDEAFAGVDATNINDMFRLMVDFRFSFIINSQILWGDCETVPKLAIYQLLRSDNAKFVTVLAHIWNGKVLNLREQTVHE
ncbi:MAG: TIGR02680 family protein [Lachnospiraceae bacterium]